MLTRILLFAGLLLWTAPAMAVITVGTPVTTKVDGAGSTTIAAPAITLTAGQGVEICTKWEGNFTVSGVASDKGDTVVLQTTQQHSALEPSGRCAHVISAVGGSTTFTTTFSGAATFRRIHVYPITYTGTLALDVQSAASTENNALTNTSSAVVTTTGPDEVCFGFHADYTTQAFTNEAINGVPADGHSTQTDTDMFYKILTATFAGGAASLTRSSSERWIERLACLKATGGGAGPPPPTGTTYYVTTTGNDSNPGTIGSPFRNPQRCQVFMVAGDTCLVDDGTYIDVDGNGITVYISGGGTGTATQPITYKSKNPLGAKISVGDTFCTSGCGTSTSYEGFHVTKNFYVIDGFEITSTSTFNGPTRTSYAGISVTSNVQGTVIKNNAIHHIGRFVCSTSTAGFAGIFNLDVVNETIDSNRIYSNGRLRVGESGCAASVPNDSNDHGIYAHGGSLVITRNVFYDNTRGWAFQSSPTLMTSLTFANNTVDGKSPTGVPAGQFQLNGGVTTGSIVNNIFSNPQSAVFRIGAAWNTSNITVDYNLTDGADSDMTFEPLLAGFTIGTHNKLSTSPGFTNIGANNYTLAAGSAAINNGTNANLTCNGVCDIGRYESFGFASASINGNSLDVLLNMSVPGSVPVVPALTGWAVNNGQTVTAANIVAGTDGLIRLTTSGGACTGGQTWTITGTSASATDKTGQPVTAFATQPVTNLCGGVSPTYVFSMTGSRFYNAFYLPNTTTVVPLSAVNATTTTIHSGVPFALDLETDCTVADCAPLGERLFYAITPLATGTKSAFQPLPDVMGTDQVAFYGLTGDPTVLNGPTPATCLIGALTPTAGSTLFTSSAIPVFDLPLNGCVVNRYMVQVGPGAVLGDIYWFEVFNQDTTALSSYTPTGGARLTVTPVAGNSAPSGLHQVGSLSNTLVDIVWTPVTDPNFAAYRVYQSSTPGVGSAGTLVKTITAASAMANHAPMTEFRTVLGVAGTYYYTVTWVDSGGQESPVSNEVAVTVTGFTGRTAR